MEQAGATGANLIMDVLFAILKVAVAVVLASSLIEALVLSVSNGWHSYDW